MPISNMDLFGKLEYNAYKHIELNEEIANGIISSVLEFNNAINSKITALSGYYHPISGESCLVLGHRCNLVSWNVDYSVCVNEKKISSFQDAIKILASVDSNIFVDFKK